MNTATSTPDLLSTETHTAKASLYALNSYQGGRIRVAKAGEQFTVQRYSYGIRVICGRSHGFLLEADLLAAI